MKISAILNQVDLNNLALPMFQRGFVWNREQVRGLMDSLYRRHPVGSLLVWSTTTDGVSVRGDAPLAPGSIDLLLDGQQRITTLYGLVRGHPPDFFDGDPKVFTGLHFHLPSETFSFYQPSRMLDDPFWISVTDLLKHGVGPTLGQLNKLQEVQDNFDKYLDRMNAIAMIGDIDIHIDEVTGEDKDMDVVVDIFNRVNSGGTKLSQGDLALAKICASWPDARDEMKVRLSKWSQAGFNFNLDWYLRCITTIATGNAQFATLRDVSTEDVRSALERAESAIDAILALFSARLGLDHDRVLGGKYAFPLLARYFDHRGKDFWRDSDQGKLLYWYVHTMLWGRYSGSTESTLNQDLALINEGDGALDRLIVQLRQQRGDLEFVVPNDFLTGWGRGARFYPLLYMLTRIYGARDWCSGIPLSAHTLGKMGQLHLHHIFPKSKLYEAGYSRREVNSLANFTFLTAPCNQEVSNRKPAEYLPHYLAQHAGAVESHWMPLDPDLWSIDRYRDFLDARRELLAAATNRMLSQFRDGSIETPTVIPSIVDRDVRELPGGFEDEEEERQLRECNEWVEQRGLSAGELIYELADEESGEALAVIDLAWPDGLQRGLSVPVAVLLDEDAKLEQIVSNAGYRFFTDIGEFQRYVSREILPGEIAA